MAAAGADVRVDVGTTQARQREILQALAAGIGHLGLEAHGGELGPATRVRRRLVPRTPS